MDTLEAQFLDRIRDNAQMESQTQSGNIITVVVPHTDSDFFRNISIDYDVTIPHAPTTYHLQMRQEGGSWKACPGAGLG